MMTQTAVLVIPFIVILLFRFTVSHIESGPRRTRNVDWAGKKMLQALRNETMPYGAGDCKCRNGHCMKDKDGNIVCECNPGYVLISEGKCIACHCNKNFGCSLKPNPIGNMEFEKICHCGKGYSVIRKKCRECECGDEFGCKFEEDESELGYKKTCICPKGYVEYKGQCRYCECGEGFGCTFKEGATELGYEKTCICPEGYAEYKGQCRKTCSNDNDCLHEGKCKKDGENSFCFCRRNLEGDHCEVVTQCSGNFSFNCVLSGGTCKYDVISESAYCECPGNKSFRWNTTQCEDCKCGEGFGCIFKEGATELGYEKTCICPEGYAEYKGKCSKPCSNDDDCLHEGKCEMVGENFFCSCRRNLEGDHCEVVTQCSGNFSSDCVLSGGTCKYDAISESAYCECPGLKRFRWNTKQCEDKHKCLKSKLCPNNTKCVIIFGAEACICEEGYRPVDKNLPIEIYGCTVVCHNESCVHGTCEPDGEKSICKCNKGFTGTHCQILVLSALELQAPWIALALTLFLALSVASFIFFHRHRKGSDNHS